MKKIFLLLVVLVLLVGVLGGCSRDSNSPSTEQKDLPSQSALGEDGEENQEESIWTGDVKHIIMTYLTLGNTPSDLQKVQDAINEKTVKQIGVEVELKPISAFDAFSQFPTWLATGETIDLMIPLLQDINSYVNQGLIEPLDSLIAEHAPYIAQLEEEGFTIASNNTINGEIWSLMSVPNVSGAGGSFLIDEKYIEETGFDFDSEKIYTLDELTELFAAIKELHPDMYPCGIVAKGRTETEFNYANGVYDVLGSKSFTGVLLGVDGTTVSNLYETEEYKNYLEYLRKWYQAGYIHPDAATTDATNVSLLNSGVSCGYFMVSAPVQRKEGQCQILLTDVRLGSQGAGGWVIPMTSKEPEAAMRFLNMMYEDESLANMIQWGIEGEHYVVLDESINLIGFPEGVDSGTSGYYNTLGLYGDARKIYVWDASQSQAENDAYTKKALENPTQGLGMIYNPSDAMAAKVVTLQSVAAQYMPAFESGSVDLDTYYPEFLSAMKAAGIDDVIQEKQQQFDEWYSNK